MNSQDRWQDDQQTQNEEQLSFRQHVGDLWINKSRCGAFLYQLEMEDRFKIRLQKWNKIAFLSEWVHELLMLDQGL